MTKVRMSVAFILLLSCTALAQGASGIQAPSAWTNQRGSMLYIQSIDPSGEMIGYYVNRAPDYGCQNTRYPVIGWVYGTAITFTVKWANPTESCNSITAWTGFYYQGVITTLWQLVETGSTNKGQIKQGEDTFTAGAKSEAESLIRK